MQTNGIAIVQILQESAIISRDLFKIKKILKISLHIAKKRILYIMSNSTFTSKT